MWWCQKLIYLLLLISFHAYSITHVQFASESQVNFNTIHQENDYYIVREYQLERGDFQELKSEKIFKSKKSAEKYAGKNQLSSFLLDAFVMSNKISQNGYLWDSKNTWNQEWEDKYATWILENIDEQFFIRHQLKVDCADVAYALRWIFSRIHFLPMAVTLQGTQQLFTNHDMKKSWKNLKRSDQWYQDQVFMKSLKYILGHTSTKTLKFDSYLVKISPSSIKVGSVHYLGGHTQVIKRISNDQNHYPIMVIESTVPAKARAMKEIPLSMPSKLVNFKWAEIRDGKIQHVENDQLPAFIAEKSHDEAQGSLSKIFKSMDIEVYPKELMTALTNGLKEKILTRSEYVNTGFEFCLQNDCSPNTQNYEDHSTPSRDKRLFEEFLVAKNLHQVLRFNYSIDFKFEDFFQKNLNIGENSINVLDYFQYYYHGLISSAPADTKSARWGFSLKDLLQTAQVKINKLLEEKSFIVQQRDLCIFENSNCINSDKSWQKTQTYGIDKKLKKLYGGLYDICVKEYQSCDQNLSPLNLKQMDELKATLFASSNPIDSIESRHGKSQDFMLLKTGITSLKELNHQYLFSYNQTTRKTELINGANFTKIDNPYENLNIGDFTTSINSNLMAIRLDFRKFTYFDTLTGSWGHEIKLDESIKEIAVLDQSIFIFTGNNVHLFQLEDRELRKQKTIATTHFHKICANSSNNHCVLLMGDDEIELYYDHQGLNHLNITNPHYRLGHLSISKDRYLLYTHKKVDVDLYDVQYILIDTPNNNIQFENSFSSKEKKCFYTPYFLKACKEDQDSNKLYQFDYELNNLKSIAKIEESNKINSPYTDDIQYIFHTKTSDSILIDNSKHMLFDNTYLTHFNSNMLISVTKSKDYAAITSNIVTKQNTYNIRGVFISPKDLLSGNIYQGFVNRVALSSNQENIFSEFGYFDSKARFHTIYSDMLLDPEFDRNMLSNASFINYTSTQTKNFILKQISANNYILIRLPTI